MSPLLPIPPSRFDSPAAVMRHALELAQRGLGYVEPNPQVGAVLVDAELGWLAGGWHEVFGGPHAEVNCLRDFERRFPDELTRAGLLRTATLFVTLEPCCHSGKTPPCTEAVIRAGVQQVVVATSDPSPHCAGRGVEQLRAAGVGVTVGMLEIEAQALLAPFVMLLKQGRPWVHAKWAMTLDGRIATRTGSSQWISNEASRAIVHQLRGRMEAIVVGAGTARADNPLLTARPPGPRTPVRIVVDSQASLALDSRLLQTVTEAPVLVACLDSAPADAVERLRQAGAEVLPLPCAPMASESVASGAMASGLGASGLSASNLCRPSLSLLLNELGRRRMTNVLIEGGAEILGASFDQHLIDELHVFVAPKLCGGGASAPGPLAGHGLPLMPGCGQLQPLQVEVVGSDVYLHSRVRRSGEP